MALNLHTLLFKTIDYCNLDCDYCYTKKSSNIKHRDPIPFSIILKTFNDYIELADEGRGTGPEGGYISYIWHGGEPTLAGIDYFKKIVEIQNNSGYSKFIYNSITTNGTILNQEWIDFIKKNEFRLSLSIDGPKDVHDLHRLSVKNVSYYDKILTNIELLKDKQCQFGIICVVTEDSVDKAEEIFSFYLKNGINRLTFLPRITNYSQLSVDRYTHFMIKIFDLWFDYDLPNIYIREFENIIHELLGGKAELCEFNGCCGSYLAIDGNGDLYLCDLFIGNKYLRIGNIQENSLKEILDSDDTLNKIALKLNLNDECISCKYLKICKGGCLYKRCLSRGDPRDKDFYCNFKKGIINHISNRLSEILPDYSIN